MAGSKYTPPLRVTREQLAAFLKDHQAIRAFENLFAATEPLTPTTIDELTLLANQAEIKAIEALQLLASIAQQAAIDSAVAENKAIQALQAVETLTNALKLNEGAPRIEPLEYHEVLAWLTAE